MSAPLRQDLVSIGTEVICSARQPMAWLDDYELTEEEMSAIADPSWIYPGLIAEGHILAVVARPNAGKTTVLFDLACEIASSWNVCYVHADTAPSDGKWFAQRARQHNVRYLTPELKAGGKSMLDVLDELQGMVNAGKRLDGWVFFFDTLKKMADVINKSSLKTLMQFLRALSGIGATIVLIGHTNKRKEQDGGFLYEGTGDLEADSDDLVYFIRDQDGDEVIVSTLCDPADGRGKMRCDIRPMTWTITHDRHVVRQDEYVDVEERISVREQRSKDQEIIEKVTELLQDRSWKQSELVDALQEQGVSSRQSRPVLKRYSVDPDRLWRRIRQSQNNAYVFELI